MAGLLTTNKRVVSAMRVTGPLHLGHYHGVLKNWAELQHQYECYFFLADWHALTTHYEKPLDMESLIWSMVVEWLACGIQPQACTIFIQSQVPEHAELHLLLSMLTPLSWLERVPSYKDQQEKLHDKDIATYGFLGYPLLQAADVLLYKAELVPVGEDQVPHVEFIREVARRFNYLYGREADFELLARDAIHKMGKKHGALYVKLRKQFQEQGEEEALKTAQALLENQHNLSLGDRERLMGYLEGENKIILLEPNVLLTKTSKLPGVDGQKMSKSYHNTIKLREDPAVVEKQILTMPTDPARVKRSDPGEPTKCPVWQLHQVYSTEEEKKWVQKGCRSASIGCIECKRVVIDHIQKELKPIQKAIKDYEKDIGFVKQVVAEGREVAREAARKTLKEIREVMGLDDY